MKRRPRSLILLALIALVPTGLTMVPITASADPGVPDHLAFTVAPASATADDAIAVEVTVQDSDNAAVAGNTDSIELTLNTGTIDVGGDPTAAADGVASFSLEIHTPGTYTLTAHDATTSLPDIESGSFTIDPGAPTTLEWVTAPPASVQATDQFGATVAAEDQWGNRVPGENIEISVQGDSFDAGTTSQPTDSNGEAAFSGLEIHTVANYTVEANDTSTLGVTGVSSPVSVTPGPPHHLTFTSQPSTTYSARATDPVSTGWVLTFSVAVRDLYDNLVDDNGDTISADLDGTVDFSGGDTTREASGGVASFDDLRVLDPGTGYTITVSDDGDPDVLTATSDPFDITAHADLQLTMTSDETNVAGLDQTYTVKVTNFGPNTNSSYTVEGTLPTDIVALGAGTDGDCSLASTTITCTRTAGIADGAFDAFDIALVVPPDYSTGVATRDLSFTTELTATDPTQEDADTDPNDATVTDAIHAEADLGVTDASSALPGDAPAWQAGPIAGTDQTFSAKVTNHGPSDNEGYTFQLAVAGLDDPGGVTLVGGSVGATSITCSSDDTNDLVTCARPGLVLDADETVTIRLAIDPSFANTSDPQTLSFTASVANPTPSDQGADANADSDGDSIAVSRAADLGIEVTTEQAGPTIISGHDAVAGTKQAFHMKVTNAGPSDNAAFTATLTVPDYDGTQLTLDSAPAACTGNAVAHTVTCTSTAILADGADRTYDIVFDISPSYTNPNTTRSLGYSAALSGLTPSNQGAATEADSTGPLSVQVDAVSDLTDIAVSQTAVETTVTTFVPTTPGNLNSVIYTVTVTNTGPSDAQSVSLTETIPSTYLETGPNKIKYCTTGATCTPTTPYYTNGSSLALGPLALNATTAVRFEAPLKIGARRGAATTLMAGDATAVVSTSTDPNPANDTSQVDINLFTVPDAPTILQAQPGNNQIGLLWKVPSDGGSTITHYDFILDGTNVTTVPAGSPSLGNGFCSPDTCKTYELAAPNGTHTVKIEARNAAGDSTPSATFTVTPCASCVIEQLATTTRTFLLSSNNTSRVITPSTPGFSSWFTNGCFPQSNNSTLPGATTSDTKVSCLDIPAGVAAAKVGALVALHDEASVTGDCPNPDGKHPCLGNQTVVSIPPGTGSTGTLTQVLIYDRTISSKVFGDPCTATPCGKKYAYIVYMRPDATSPAVPIGSTVQNGVTLGSTAFPAWCPTSGGNPVIPTGKIACVVSYVIISGNSNPNPFPNGNSSNGSEGNGDMRLTILFRGDPRTAP